MLNMEESHDVREDNMPIGLSNSDQICYFNSILQAYYANREFVKDIMEFEESIKD